ncbi:MAG: AAA family ATPase, partial [Thermoleophilia bacterium]
ELQISAARVRERERVAGMTIERFRPALERLEHDLASNTFQLGACGLLEPVAGRLLAIMDKLKTVYEQSAHGVEQKLGEGEEESERQSAGLRELSQAEAQLQQQLSHASDASTEREVSVNRLRDQVDDQSDRLKGLNEKFPDAGLVEEEAAPAEELDIFAEQIDRLVRRREQIGPVNPLAQQEYEEMLERQKFMEEQRTDLEQSLDELSGLIKELTDRIESTFTATFEAVKRHFSDVVATLFPGGEGRLTLVDPPSATDGMEDDDSAESGVLSEEEADELAASMSSDRRGIEISVKPARKAVRSLSLLSGGERSLVAIAFLFAIFLARPAPFYILDEVEAALDDVNIDRLLTMLRRYQNRTQFIVITHQKRTMEVADVLYGVSMGADGTSKVLSRKMPMDPVSTGRAEETLETVTDDTPEGSGADDAGVTHEEAEPAAIAS